MVVVGFAVGAPYGAVLGAFLAAAAAEAVFAVPADFAAGADFGSAPLSLDFVIDALVDVGAAFVVVAAGSDVAVGALVAAGFCAPDPPVGSRTTVGSLVSARATVAGFAAAAGGAATGAVGTSVADLADGTPVAGVVGAPGTGVGSPFVTGFDAPLVAALLGLAIVFGRAAEAVLAAGAGFGVASLRTGVGAGFGVASLRTGVGEGSGRCGGAVVAAAVGWRTTVFALVAPAAAPVRVLVRGRDGGASVVCFTRSASFSSEATGVCWSCSHSATSIASSSTTEASSSGDFFVTASPP